MALTFVILGLALFREKGCVCKNAPGYNTVVPSTSAVGSCCGVLLRGRGWGRLQTTIGRMAPVKGSRVPKLGSSALAVVVEKSAAAHSARYECDAT